MTEPSARAVVEVIIRAIEARDFAAHGAMLTDDDVDEMPHTQ